MVGARLSSEVGIQVFRLECIDEEMTATPEEIAGYSPLPSNQETQIQQLCNQKFNFDLRFSNIAY